MMQRKTMTTLVAGLLAAAGISTAVAMQRSDTSRSHDEAQAQRHAEMFQGVQYGTAVLHPTEENDVRGEVYLREEQGQVTITARVEGLEPDSTHGIHIHEYGDCTAADATSAGGHYNPEDHPHALPPEQPRHAGDLGNLVADNEGVAEYEITVENISIAGLENPVIGRAVIVHASEDTGAQPTGEAGARLACGVIGLGNPENDFWQE
ncbi:MAG: superoxide dismutase family protein [Phycisphaeraceae bacterium]